MSLATRCPACGTVFRVVRDQLKVSDGWVRCGRCSDVFDAGRRLFDLEAHSAPPAAQQSPAAPAQPAERVAPAATTALSPTLARVSAAFAPPSEPAALPAHEPEHVPAPAHPGPGPGPGSVPDSDPAPAPAMAGADSGAAACDTAVDTVDTDKAVEAVEAVETVEAAQAADAAPPLLPLPPAEAAAAAASGATPEFILRAERAERWRHPARRGALAGLSLLLGLLLTAQIALHYRDGLAAGWPVSQPWLQAACNVLGCRIEAPRRIDSLSVDSSGLLRVEGSSLYRLSLVLQNKASTRVHMPAIELALTDTQGQTMARRVLVAAELGQAADSLPPRGEVLLQATLELGEQRVAGYTLELFYP